MQNEFSTPSFNQTVTTSDTALPIRSKSWIMRFSEGVGRKFSSFKSFTPTRNFHSPKFKIPKLALLLLVAILIGGTIIFLVKSTKAQNANMQTSASMNNNSKPAAPVTKATDVLNKEFSFPIKDAAGHTISQIKYVITSATLQDEILVKGERARAVQGRTFLILNLMITNNYKQGIQINSRDYVRLIVDGKKDELLAGDIHNDPVEVQAISTKITRLGFPIDENFKTLELQVGEINGKKESLPITFPLR